MGRLTLCMIVKDEERLLRDCLESAAPAVDRIVIVDTGSEDATRSIAEEFSAEIVDHPWADDFAAARNAGLARVDEGFVLVLDADERLGARAAQALRAAVEADDLDFGLLPLHEAAALDASVNDVVSGPARRGEVAWQVRLLRVTPELSYQGVICEAPAHVALQGRRLEAIDAPIAHYGPVRELPTVDGPARRKRALLERRCEARPDDVMACAQLASVLEASGETDAALAGARAGWRAWRRGRQRGSRRYEAVLPASVMARLALRVGELDEADAVLAEALAFEAHPNLNLLAGIVSEQRVLTRGGGDGELERAAQHFLRCIALHGQAYASPIEAGATSWQPASRLGHVQLLRGRIDEARAAFAHALAAHPELHEAKLGRIEAGLRAGEAADALAELEGTLREDEPDGWLLAALASLELGQRADARLFVERSRAARAQARFVGEHRERRLVELEREFEADPAPDPTAGDAAANESAEVCVFAWPHYDDPSDLAAFFRRYGKLLSTHEHAVLCLRFDPALDGPFEAAASQLEAAYAAQLGGTELSLIMVDQPLSAPGEVAALAGPGDVAVIEPHADPVRQRFFAALGVRSAATPEELQALLANPALSDA